MSAITNPTRVVMKRNFFAAVDLSFQSCPRTYWDHSPGSAMTKPTKVTPR